MNFQMFKLDLEKAEEPDQIAYIHWIIEKAREFQEKKHICFCFIDYAKAFDCVNHNGKFFKRRKLPDHFTCLLRNLYAGQEATVRTRKEYIKAVYCHPAYLTYMFHIMQNARLDEA